MHAPVLQKEVLKYLAPRPNENFIDATVDGGGHSAAILEKISSKGKILGIDWSPEIIKNLKKQNIIPVCDNFANLKEIVKKKKFGKVEGVLFDLGMSSWHLEGSGRGFSFLKKEPLDMRYSPRNQLTAEKIINFWSKFELEKIFREYGQERFARNIAEEIVKTRKTKPVNNTMQLVEIIKKAVPKSYCRKKLHPATKTFQALRITVNNELDNLSKALPQAQEILKSGGRLVLISFHSLEDRIVKNFFRERFSENELKILTKKPITASAEEIKANPRARSAKLRAAVKI